MLAQIFQQQQTFLGPISQRKHPIWGQYHTQTSFWGQYYHKRVFCRANNTTQTFCSEVSAQLQRMPCLFEIWNKTLSKSNWKQWWVSWASNFKVRAFGKQLIHPTHSLSAQTICVLYVFLFVIQNSLYIASQYFDQTVSVFSTFCNQTMKGMKYSWEIFFLMILVFMFLFHPKVSCVFFTWSLTFVFSSAIRLLFSFSAGGHGLLTASR